MPEAGASADLDAIAEVVRTALAHYKHPRDIRMIDALPRNTMRKVQKNALRHTYRDAFIGS